MAILNNSSARLQSFAVSEEQAYGFIRSCYRACDSSANVSLADCLKTLRSDFRTAWFEESLQEAFGKWRHQVTFEFACQRLDYAPVGGSMLVIAEQGQRFSYYQMPLEQFVRNFTASEIEKNDSFLCLCSDGVWAIEVSENGYKISCLRTAKTSAGKV